MAEEEYPNSVTNNPSTLVRPESTSSAEDSPSALIARVWEPDTCR